MVDNAVSSLRGSVEVEVFSPPTANELHLQWIPVEDVETPEDLCDYLANRDEDLLSPGETITLGPQVEYPQRMMMACPSEPGLYALAAWSSDEARSIHALDVTKMDLVWVFKDTKYQKDGDSSPRTKPLVADDEMELYEKTRKDELEALDKIEEEPMVLYHSNS